MSHHPVLVVEIAPSLREKQTVSKLTIENQNHVLKNFWQNLQFVTNNDPKIFPKWKIMAIARPQQ